MALLDEHLLGSAVLSVPVLFALAERATRRSRTLGALALTRTMRRTDERLLFVLTLLACRWGRMRPDGIRLALPVGHELLARLIGTRRQAVTTALGDLRSRGLIDTLANGDWLLSAEDPMLSEAPTDASAKEWAPNGIPAGEVNFLQADIGLAGVLSSAQLTQAAPGLRARTQLLSPGGWDPPAADEDSCKLGALILEGFLSLETGYRGKGSLEILGPGDLLRPWDEDLFRMPAITNDWRVLTPTTIALLDDELAERIAAWPALTSEILARAGCRARWLVARLAISQQIHIRDRILYLFSRLASRWGGPCASGTIVPVPVTHEQIAKLIGAQRPSVTLAIGELAGEGLLTRFDDRTWCMHTLDPAGRDTAAAV